MAKPALTDIDHGVQGWDATVSDNNAILRDAPMPIKEYADETTLPAAASFDRCVAAITAHTRYGACLAFSDGARWRFFPTLDRGANNAAGTVFGHAEASSGALPAAGTYTFNNLVPAGVLLLGVSVRVTTLITGATSFDVGDGTTADLFGNDVAVALNTTTDLANHKATWLPALYLAAGNVVLTANGGNFSAGVVRATAHFIKIFPPTA